MTTHPTETRSAGGVARSRLAPGWTVVGAALLLASCALAGCSRAPAADLGGTITLAQSGGSSPTLAIAADGTVLVAWVGSEDGASNVYLARLDAAGSPRGSPVRVNDISGDAHPHEQAPAQVAVAGNGEIYVIWQRKVEAPWLEFGGADLRFARSTDGGRTFEPAMTVNDNDPSSPARISFHDLAVSPEGTVYVSWIDARERDRAREEAFRMTDEDTSDPALHPAHAHGSMDEPGTEIRVAQSSDGGRSFSESVVVDRDSCPCCRTTLAVGENGAVYTAWRKIFEGGIRDIAVSRSLDGGQTFEAARPVHDDGWEFSACPHAGPSLAMDGSGTLHAAWYTGADDRQGLWYAASVDGGTSFGAPLAIVTDDWVPPSQARLATDEGRVWVAWDDLREEARRVRLALVSDGEVLRVADELPGHSPAIAASAGRGAVAWLDGEAVRVLTFEAVADASATAASTTEATVAVAEIAARPGPLASLVRKGHLSILP